MSTFVLVPGFWLGGWAWQGVTERLRAMGHVVYPATLTGLGERVHLGGPHVNLDTQIADVVNLLRYEDLHDAMLVGHSFAGNVVAGAADQVSERIAQLVFVDTWPLPEGFAQVDLLPPEAKEAQQRQVDTEGEGWRLPLPPWEELDQGRDLAGLGEPERKLFRERAVAQPYGTATQPVGAKDPRRDSCPKTAIWCSLTTDEVRELTEAYPDACSTLTEPGWRFLELPTGHWPMFSKPRELAELLASLA